MKEILEFGLMLAGAALVVLSIASAWIPKALGWKEKLAGLSPLMREMWWTYSLYVWASHVFFAVLVLGFHDWLLSKTPAAGLMAGFILIWWSVRLYLQFFGYDLTEVADTWTNRIAKHLLTLLFVSLIVIFGLVLMWNLGDLR